jgi:hypothetical protein
MLLARAGQPLLGAVSFRRLSEQTRSIHIPKRVIPPSSPANLVHRTRAFFSQLITQLQGQGPPVSRFTHSSPSIRQSLSLPARIALSRPLRAPCLPRAPRVPGNVTQVGLGTARNFSTARPIFQNLVQNVPVAGRTFYQVDWDLNLRKEKNSKVRRPKSAHRKVKLADKLTPLPEHSVLPTSPEELLDYFQFPSEPLVTTYLQIPLAPTPTSRVPLSSSSSPRLLPLPALAKEHASHSKHAIRVSSLFRRLDAARVWQRGATCETFGDPSGLCIILRVRFAGWSEDMVKGVLGDAGKEWCTIQEMRPLGEVQSEPPDSQMSPPVRPASSNSINEMAYVMPILDFSSSIAAEDSPPSSWSPMPSRPRPFSDGGSYYTLSSMPASVVDEESAPPSSWSSMPSSPRSFSDDGSDYSFPAISDEESVVDISAHDPSLPPSTVDEWSSVARSPTTSPSSSWLGFSSDFAARTYPEGGGLF